MIDKDELKTQTKYELKINVGLEMYEDIIIHQEENMGGRDIIKLTLYKTRWRTPKDTVILLEGVIAAINKYFIEDKK